MNKYRVVTSATDRARFDAAVAVGDPEDCWPWTKAISNGYGVLRMRGVNRVATHLALEYSGSPRPGRAEAIHSCDNPSCCNPRHLSWASHKANMDDRDRKDRVRHGSAHASAKLTEDDIPVIIRLHREEGLEQQEIARQYGVAKSTISAIFQGRTWKRETIKNL